MEQVGRLNRLPSRTALRIAVQGIRIRLGRSMVTVSGVVLGIAFLMSNLTSQLIKESVSAELAAGQTVNMMESLVRAEIGNLQDQTIAVAVVGEVTPNEQAFVARLLKAQPKEVRSTTWAGAPAGVRICPAAELGHGAAILLVLGHASQVPFPIEEAMVGMDEKVLLDSLATREYKKGLSANIRRELFFGKEAEDQSEKQRTAAADARFRTLWITFISILVTVIGISNALLMSVTERFKEIGTMKCLGALSGFIRRMFLIESAIIGLAGSLAGTLVGAILTFAAYGMTFPFGLMFSALHLESFAGAAVFCTLAGTVLSMLAAIYPANFAARMIPASALRSNI
ncbi:MAG: FtsX-like permease family protein [bacterium]